MATYPGYRQFNRLRPDGRYNRFGVRIVLTPAMRVRIRERILEEGEKPMDLALEYGVTASYIRHLAQR